MELSDVRTAVRRYWFLYFLAVAFWLGVGSMMAFLPESQYRASATIVASPSGAIEGNPAQFVSFQIPTIVATIESRSFRDDVRASLPPAMADRDVSIAGSSEIGTGLITIAAEGTDPAALAVWATAFAEAIISVQSTDLLVLALLDPAAVPGSPISPERTSTLVGAGALGMISGLLLCVAAFRVRKALNFDEEVQRRLALPIIGRIPSARALRRSSTDTVNTILNGPPEVVEAFQSMRTNLVLGLSSRDKDVVAVASWAEGEGKTTIAAGIALTLANSGTSVVAIDADLRRPQLHVVLGEPFGEGLADVAKRGPEGLIRPTRQRQLWFLPAGIPDRHPTDVLTANLPKVIDVFCSSDRRIVLDAPPFNGIAETPMILAAAGAVVIVIDARRSRLPELEQMVTSLQGAGVNIMGVVLNRVSLRRRKRAYASYAAR